MSRILNSEWLNSNSRRSYPIKESSTQTDISGTYVLPTDLIVDLIFAVDVHKDRNLYLKYLTVLSDVITGQLFDTIDEPAATFTIDVSAHKTYDAYQLTGVKDYTNSIGKIVIGELAPVLSNPLGLFEFELKATVFESRVIIPHIRGVTSISKSPIGETTFPRLQGNVVFKDGNNTRVVIDPVTLEIRIDAIEGAGLGPVCDCPEDTPSKPCISFINGIAPDDAGNFNVRGVGCIVVRGIENGIEIENTCVTNCCDCEDIDALDARILALEAIHGI